MSDDTNFFTDSGSHHQSNGRDAKPKSESELLTVISESLEKHGLKPDLSDDCALLQSETKLVSTDAMIEDVHFDLAWDSLEQVGAQAAVINLSDIAGSGGKAQWLLWSLVLPLSWTLTMVRRLTDGFAKVSVDHGVEIVGGNLARTAGPAMLSVTAGGALISDKPLCRKGANIGDSVWVSGALGNAALGYRFPNQETRSARHAWRPHLQEAAALMTWGKVTAGMDISDGLVRDCERLAEASGVGIDIKAEAIPVSPLYRREQGNDRTLALTGGEDYVLLFTTPPGQIPPLKATKIGSCVLQRGVRVDGNRLSSRGYDHFGDGVEA